MSSDDKKPASSSSSKARKIFSLYIYKGADGDDKAMKLFGVEDLYPFPYLQRSPIREYIRFFSQTVVDRSKSSDEKQSVVLKENMGLAHVIARPNGLRAVVLCGAEYPPRVAFNLLIDALNSFEDANKGVWPLANTPEEVKKLSTGEPGALFKKYQNVDEMDKLAEAQRKVDDTKEIVQKTLESMLDRQENLEELMKASEEVSETSYQMYKKSKNVNKCCKM